MRTHLDKTDRTFAEILLADSDGVMDREELRSKAMSRRMNVNTFSVYTSYSPILKHIGQDLWTYRGNHPSPATLALYTRKRRTKSLTFEWNSDGHLIVRYTLPNEESPVVGYPNAIRRFVASRDFLLELPDAPPSMVRVGEDGMSWGYSGFTQSRGARKGDVLELDIDIVAGRMVPGLLQGERK
jgi:hypothetical protein